MKRWQLLREIRAALKDPARAGDVAAYKGELTGARARPSVETRLDAIRDYRPSTDFEQLATLPPGTFGREYARFMQANQLRPIVPTDRVDPALIARNAFTVRYAAIHDMVHVLTGFDTSWPGEVGVWAFVGGQNFSFGFRIAAVVALLFAPLRAPLRMGQAWRNFRVGWAMGKQARLMLVQRLEERFEHRLADVRAELRVQGAGDGYIPRALATASTAAR